jgi:hypothetical protein
MPRTVLSSMRWRSCRGVLHRLQLSETLIRIGLSNFSKLALRQNAAGVLDLRALAQGRNVRWATPTSVASQCSVMKSGKNWIVTASGGVLIDAWRVANNSNVTPSLDRPRVDLSERWWGN